MTISERDMTRLSLLMASLVSSPAQAEKFIDLVRRNELHGELASIVDALRAELQAEASHGQPSRDTLRGVAESLIHAGAEPKRTAGRLLAAALESR
jgi:hypothetical protein